MESGSDRRSLGALRSRFGRWRGAGADSDGERGPTVDLSATLAEISSLTAINRGQPDAERERRLLLLRHRAGAALVRQRHERPPERRESVELDPESGLAEIPRSRLSAPLVRGAIETHGYLLVRGLIDGGAASALAAGIEHTFTAREALRTGAAAEPGYYEEFTPEPPYGPLAHRAWIEEGGASAIADSPAMLFQMLDEYERNGLLEIVAEFLGEPVTISAQKCALRRTDPQQPGGWHQDGAFMGRVRALNVWLCLSSCGERAPGLDVVPRRLDGIIPTGGEGTMVPNQVGPRAVEDAAGATGVVRPRFEPGDAMLFDDVFLHRTGAEEDMPESRYAIECWFFGASGFPESYVPLAA